MFTQTGQICIVQEEIMFATKMMSLEEKKNNFSHQLLRL